MKKILLDKNENRREYYLRIEKEEELFSALSKFAKKEKIGFATFTGLGANKNTVYGEFFDGEYKKISIQPQYELNSLNGNIGWKNSEPMIHCHAMFSKLEDGEMKATGGHIYEMTSAVTIEISLIAYKPEIARKYAPECKLNLLDLEYDIEDYEK